MAKKTYPNQNKNKQNVKNVSYKNAKGGTAVKKNDKSWIIYVSIVAAVILVIVLIVALAGTTKGKQNADGDLVIPLSSITKNVKIYSVKVEGTRMEVMVARTSSGDIRTAFNTCRVCYDSGKGYYKASGNTVTCQNCGNKYTVDQFTTAQSDGCMPWAISASNRKTVGDDLVISYSYLKSQKSIFAKWK